MRALGVAASERARAIPDVPTFAEQGIKDQEADTLTGIVAPAGTPKEIVDLLYREIAKAVAQPDVKERLTALGFKPVANKPDEFGARIKLEMEKWGKVVRDAEAEDRVSRASDRRCGASDRSLSLDDERQADPVLLDPGDPALVNDRGILRHHEAKALRDEGRVLDVDRRPLERNIAHHATHHGTARRNIGGFLDLGSRMLSLLFHPFGPGFAPR